MKQLEYLNEHGDFSLRDAQKYPYVYFPLVNEGGMMSSVTPLLSGDCKTGQDSFLLPPASAETLHESRATRNFWIKADGVQPWSVTGVSAPQEALRYTDRAEETVLTGGLLWQRISRENKALGIHAETLSFVPAGTEKIEIMQVTLTNTGENPVEIQPTAVVPIYGRSADNIRDHRHVTSLLHRVELRPHGVDVTPTLTFDERGHQPGKITYRVWGGDEVGAPPQGFVPLTKDFVGEGSWDWPEAVVCPKPDTWYHAGQRAQGGEVSGALFFQNVTLTPGEKRRYQIVLAIDDNPTPYLTPDGVEASLKQTKDWWQSKVTQTFHTGNDDFNIWTQWVAVQPTLRRIFGCSFLPHHDYGRGGRGWRDLWQDSLALLLTDPAGTRDNLLSYFAGVRIDGTNATIIGDRPGEFKADRNNIPRIWMDHSFWPLLTVALYIDETGDDGFLLKKEPYFADTLYCRGEKRHRQTPNNIHEGTVLEHLVIQFTTAFFDVGEHGFMRLRGADWNDGLDMAKERGESVAFTAAYAYGFKRLSEMIARLKKAEDGNFELSVSITELLSFDANDYGKIGKMQKALSSYCEKAEKDTEKTSVSASKLIGTLQGMASWICRHIAQTEWVGDGADLHWVNSYYDNSGRQVEGLRGETVRMMLTGQVFCILSGTADDAQVREIVRAADWYLNDTSRGGYSLNTDFGEVKLDMGRMFGFAYGNKENGAVFSHMAVMYAYALYSRGFVKEGLKVLEFLYCQSSDFSQSRILPGIPEYFDNCGRGMYPYLTGAASWYMLTMQTEVFGVHGVHGDLMLFPKLAAGQFDINGTAEIRCVSAGRNLRVQYENPSLLDWGEYMIGTVTLGDVNFPVESANVIIPQSELPAADKVLDIKVTLVPKSERKKSHV